MGAKANNKEICLLINPSHKFGLWMICLSAVTAPSNIKEPKILISNFRL
jgi:hypothetical protein